MNNSLDILRFDEVLHEYFIGDRRIPSVSEILRGVGAIDTKWFHYDGAQRGIFIHQLTELIDRDELDWFEVNDEVIGYLRAYEKFKNENKFEINSIEGKIYSKEHWFAGTLDRGGALNSIPVVLDIKTGQKQKWWKWQLAAYKILIGEEVKRITLRLRPNGRYSIDEYDNDEMDMEIFIAMAKAYNAVLDIR